MSSTADPSDASDVRDRLLSHLGGASNWRDVRTVAPLTPVFGGNQSFVYALRLEGRGVPEGPLILRILRPFLDGSSVLREASMQEVLLELGYPVARVHHACPDPHVLGGAFQLMERLPGSPLLGGGEATQGTIGLRAALRDFRSFVFGPWPHQLAELHARLHALPVDRVRAGLAERGIDPDSLSFARALERSAARLGADASPLLVDAYGWLRERRTALDRRPAVLCHGDFFPNQVLAEAGRISGVIDWTDVCFAPAELDVVELQVGIETLPVPLGPVGPPILRARARRFLEAYTELAGAPDPEIRAYVEVLRCTRSLLAVSERRRAIGEGADPATNPNPYDTPDTVRGFEERIRRGIAVGS